MNSKKLKLIFPMILLLIPLSVRGDNAFGNLTWNDGITEVAEKLFEMNSGAAVTFTVTDKEIINSLSDIQTVLDQNYLFLLQKSLFTKYIDVNGNEQSYFSNPVTFSTGGIEIDGIPFEIDVELRPAPGFAATYPEKILTANGSRNIHIPHAIDAIKLSTNAPVEKIQTEAFVSAMRVQFTEGSFTSYGNGSGGDITSYHAEHGGTSFEITSNPVGDYTLTMYYLNSVERFASAYRN